MRGDVLSVETDSQRGDTLITQVMRAGERLGPAPTLIEIRERAAAELKRLPAPLKRLEAFDYPVTISDTLHALAAEADRHNLGR
jgi:nicotinate phosphoribosyltransferase